MQVFPFCGVRNISVYCCYIREKLKLSRNGFARLTGSSKQEIYRIEEWGFLPSKSLLFRFKLINKILPLIISLQNIYNLLKLIISRFFNKIIYHWHNYIWILERKMTKEGQLTLLMLI